MKRTTQQATRVTTHTVHTGTAGKTPRVRAHTCVPDARGSWSCAVSLSPPWSLVELSRSPPPPYQNVICISHMPLMTVS